MSLHGCAQLAQCAKNDNANVAGSQARRFSHLYIAQASHELQIKNLLLSRGQRKQRPQHHLSLLLPGNDLIRLKAGRGQIRQEIKIHDHCAPIAPAAEVLRQLVVGNAKQPAWERRCVAELMTLGKGLCKGSRGQFFRQRLIPYPHTEVVEHAR